MRNSGAAKKDDVRLLEDDIAFEGGQPRLFLPALLRRNDRRQGLISWKDR